MPAFSASPSSSGRLGRRGVLQAGLLAAGGLNLSNLLRLEAAQETTARRPKSVIFLFLHGGPSQLETYDLKPQATSEVRGPCQPIATRVPGLVLMENAGRGTAEWLRELRPAPPVRICCGKGNNGGDGFVMARHLELFGIAVEVLVCCDPAELTGDARVNYDVVTAAGLPRWHLGREGSLADLATRVTEAGWIVDALLGTGARGAPRDPLAGVIRAINAAARPVLAVDLPSGLDADSGEIAGECVRADYTATFVAPKQGFSDPNAVQWTDQVRVVEIGIPRLLRDRVLQPSFPG